MTTPPYPQQGQPQPDPGPHAIPGLPQPGQAPAPEVGPQTQNERLHDGVNRCPRCGSTEIQLRASAGELVCLFCRHQWSEARVEETLGLGEGLDQLSGTVVASGAADISADAATVMTLKCSGCGAEVVVNVSEGLNARCHWCRHVLSINEQVPNGAVPDAILPFSLTHDQAVEKIRAFAGKRRLFAHRRFKAEFTPENVVGVYMPYMVVDAKARSQVAGVGEIQTRRWTEGSKDNRRTYYDADVFRVERGLEFTVDDLAVESSAERAQLGPASTNNVINTIQPFDTKNAVVWNADYLRGFTSERRDQNVEELRPRVEDELMSIARAQVEPSLGRFDRGVRWEQEHLDVAGTRWVAMYLPVWLYSYYHVQNGRGMVHYIAVNGRTGETMGSIPLAMGKLWLAALTVGTLVEGLVLAFLVAAA
jgi:DNA-directed RNA polymerase subunit RPC12/RpoP